MFTSKLAGNDGTAKTNRVNTRCVSVMPVTIHIYEISVLDGRLHAYEIVDAYMKVRLAMDVETDRLRLNARNELCGNKNSIFLTA